MLVIKDILSWFPEWKPEIVVDVGACIGQVSREFINAFPEAKVYAFEPHTESFNKLVRQAPEAIAHELALSSHTGLTHFTSDKGTTGNRIAEDGDREIPCIRGDEFFSDADHIGYLKIDAEGHDVEVLKGFGDKLDIVDFVQVEAAMNRHVKQCPPYRDLEDYLVGRGFYLFYIYDACFEFKQGPQVSRIISLRGRLLEYIGGAPVMRRADAVFINPNIVGPIERVSNA